jgi:hypothetical protein
MNEFSRKPAFHSWKIIKYMHSIMHYAIHKNFGCENSQGDSVKFTQESCDCHTKIERKHETGDSSHKSRQRKLT